MSWPDLVLCRFVPVCLTVIPHQQFLVVECDKFETFLFKIWTRVLTCQNGHTLLNGLNWGKWNLMNKTVATRSPILPIQVTFYNICFEKSYGNKLNSRSGAPCQPGWTSACQYDSVISDETKTEPRAGTRTNRKESSLSIMCTPPE